VRWTERVVGEKYAGYDLDLFFDGLEEKNSATRAERIDTRDSGL